MPHVVQALPQLLPVTIGRGLSQFFPSAAFGQHASSQPSSRSSTSHIILSSRRFPRGGKSAQTCKRKKGYDIKPLSRVWKGWNARLHDTESTTRGMCTNTPVDNTKTIFGNEGNKAPKTKQTIQRPFIPTCHHNHWPATTKNRNHMSSSIRTIVHRLNSEWSDRRDKPIEHNPPLPLLGLHQLLLVEVQQLQHTLLARIARRSHIDDPSLTRRHTDPCLSQTILLDLKNGKIT